MLPNKALQQPATLAPDDRHEVVGSKRACRAQPWSLVPAPVRAAAKAATLKASSFRRLRARGGEQDGGGFLLASEQTAPHKIVKTQGVGKGLGHGWWVPLPGGG